MALSARNPGSSASRQPNSPRPRGIERLLKQEQTIVVASIFVIVLGAVWYTVAGVGMQMSALSMTRMAGPIGQPMPMGEAGSWSVVRAAATFAMWWVMMIAMMTPSAAPAILLYIALKRVGPKPENAVGNGLAFLLGYLAAWAVFSLGATGVQWALQQVDLINGPMMTVRSRLFSGTLLIAAGAYQFSNLKYACLHQCQSPAMFLTRHSRSGPLGAFRTGALHGSYCLGCCWALMALLFVGGIMNLWWIAGIAIYVALEKLLPRVTWLAPMTGAALIGIGGWLFATSLF